MSKIMSEVKNICKVLISKTGEKSCVADITKKKKKSRTSLLNLLSEGRRWPAGKRWDNTLRQAATHRFHILHARYPAIPHSTILT